MPALCVNIIISPYIMEECDNDSDTVALLPKEARKHYAPLVCIV